MSKTIEISPQARKTVKELLQRHLPGVTVWAYGSRVKWTARPESDLDLVVFVGQELCSSVENIREAFEESNLPFRVDVFIWDEVPEKFRREIQEGYVVMQRGDEKNQMIEIDELNLVLLEDCLECVIDNRGKTPPLVEEETDFEILEVNSLAGSQKAPNYDVVKKHVDQQVYNTWFRSGHPRRDDILISTVGSIGEVSLMDKDRGAIAQNVIALRFKREIANPNYIYYYLSQPRVKNELVSLNISSVQPSIKVPHLLKLVIRLLPLQTQTHVAILLSSLDDKIELNRRMNQTLEEMAQTIFKSWFVDFEPVKAKRVAKALGCDPERAAMAALSGKLSVPKNPAGLSVEDLAKAEAELDQLGEEEWKQLEQTAALFPDGFAESELGLIPEGWEVKKLKDITDKIGSGATPRGGGKVYVEEGIAFIRSQNVHDYSFLWSGLVRMTDREAEKLKGVTVEEEDVLINITGDSILRTCVVDPKVLPARVNQHVSIIRASHPIPARYLHLYLVRPEIKNLLLGFDAGGSRKAITKGHLESLPVTVPPATALLYFQKLIENMYKRVEANNNESHCLSSIRDKLLPKLLSGELSIPEAETVKNALAS